MNRDSNKNQSIKGKFVEREVLSCQSMLVDMLLQQEVEGFSYDDIENIYIDNSEEIEELEEKRDNIQEQIDELEEQDQDTSELERQLEEMENQIEELEEEQEEPQEIYEWWLVTGWFTDKLREHNEPILDNDYGIWWGRTCTGQAILLDGVISDICEEMGILEGQEYEWKVD